MILCLCPNPSIDKYIWIKNVQAGRVNRVMKEKSYAGGKGIHVAMGVRELGEEVTVLGFWDEINGKWIKNQCSNLGIECMGPEVKDWNRICLTFQSEDKFNETEILGRGPDIKEEEFLSFFDTFKRLLNESDFVIMSGSWPKTFNNADYSTFLDLAKEKNKTTFVDRSGELLRKAVDYYPDTIHVSLREGKELYREIDSIEQIAESLSGNCRQTVVTNGEKGFYMHVDNQRLHASVQVKNIISAVGSGDSLLAGLVYARVHSYSVEDTARIAAACGAANCLREDLGMFYKKDVERLFKQVRLKNF